MPIREQLFDIAPVEIADLIAATTRHVRRLIWGLVEDEDAPLALIFDMGGWVLRRLPEASC